MISPAEKKLAGVCATNPTERTYKSCGDAEFVVAGMATPMRNAEIAATLTGLNTNGDLLWTLWVPVFSYLFPEEV